MTPNPGSQEAAVAGCTCPRMDNGYGLGAYGADVKGPDGKPLYWITAGCPLHDTPPATPNTPE